MTGGPVNVAIVGLGFGEDFLPVYAAHPDVGTVGIVDPAPERLAQVGNRHGITDRFADIAEVLADDRWHAVHVLAPVSFHADYAVRVLEAGKHCACAVPMATELADLERIVRAQRDSGKHYMMMETSVYGRECLLAEDLYRTGRLGELTMYRGFHIQNLDGYPSYWQGYPPMKYVTHALSPILRLTGSAVQSVTCYGSGTLTPDRRGAYDNPFPGEVGLFRLRDHAVVPEITMSFFQTARTYIEGFSVYGDKMSLEWPDVDGDPLRAFELQADPVEQTTGLRGRRSEMFAMEPPDFADRLPGPLARYTKDFSFTAYNGEGESVRRAEHGGSHPYLVDEFVSSIVQDRGPQIDAVTSADWTAPGICAHDSALQGGVPVTVPHF